MSLGFSASQNNRLKPSADAILHARPDCWFQVCSAPRLLVDGSQQPAALGAGRIGVGEQDYRAARAKRRNMSTRIVEVLRREKLLCPQIGKFDHIRRHRISLAFPP